MPSIYTFFYTVFKTSLLLLSFSQLLIAQSSHNSANLFIYGVASGDPLQERVIIWTRISPPNDLQPIVVSYYVAKDSGFQQIINQGKLSTHADKDFTIKVDVTGLEAGQTYFYHFEAFGQASPIGRTKTATKNSQEKLRFAVMSCSNYEDGYFHAYRHVAQQTNLNAIIHLGDYIYESFYTTKRKTRDHLPAKELITLHEYRQRYAQYHLDADLQEAHRLHPFISVWDDHEASNNAYKDGAIYHTAENGKWENRLTNAKKAYFEWMPIRNHPQQRVYRKISYGNLMDLIMLDTRLEGREQQVKNTEDERFLDSSRTMLGVAQRAWLLSSLDSSKAKWKVIGNQVIFSPLYGRHIHSRAESLLLDIWNGYPAERLKITQFLRENQINNTLFITGDFHSSLVFEVPVDDWNYPLTATGPDYEVETGEHAVAVEFVTPSITSQNFDEFSLYAIPFRPFGRFVAKFVERKFLKASIRDKQMPDKRRTINPHLKWTNLRAHGYMTLTLTPQKAQVDYYFVDKPWKKNVQFRHAKKFEVKEGANRLSRD